MKEQAYNMIKTKDSRTQRQSNLNQTKEARFKISAQEFEDQTLGEIVSLKYVCEHGSSEFARSLASGEISLNKSDFGDKRRGWIQSCLNSSRGSVMVNGRPTKEFQFHGDLKQGDPLSPFLFILIMERLYISVERVVDAGMFKGLRINMNKSKLMGISVANIKVDQVAAKIRRETLKAPFSYLGSKVGDLMSHIQPWNDILNKLTSRLSKWKMKTLSIRGRLTLLKSVLGSMPIYNMSLFKVPMKVLQRMEAIKCHFFNGVDHNSRKPIWVKWSMVLAFKEKGGLGVSSLYALNRALLFKWVWRFHTQSSSLWARVIKGIHGEDGKLDNKVKYSHPSIWLNIVREMEHLKNNGTNLFSFIHKKIGNGADTSFWEDIWRGNDTLKSLYLRVYSLETCKNISVAKKMSYADMGFSLRRSPRGGIEQAQYNDLSPSLEDINLVDMRDRWIWSLEGTGDFSIRSRIDDTWLREISSKTRWIKAVPIKVNIHA
ncbi:hypothetical protein Tco_1318463 [Tanacetum coccineum]